MRYGGTAIPGIFESLQEVIGDAAASGASLHVVHINSQAVKKTPEALRMIEGAHADWTSPLRPIPTSQVQHYLSPPYLNQVGKSEGV